MERVTIVVTNTEVRFIGSKEAEAALADTGVVTKRRASHVEPVNRVLRYLFHAIRSRVDDQSTMAEFTRRWPCRWQARIFNGPTLGPFNDRAVAIAAEVEWINANALGGRSNEMRV